MTREELQALESARHEGREREQLILSHFQDELNSVPQGRRWAKRILILHENGCHVASISLQMAREALGVSA